MKKINVFVMSAIALAAIIVFSAFANRNTVEPASKKVIERLVSASTCSADPDSHPIVSQGEGDEQMVNLFVTHGHCSSPFSGKVENLELIAPYREDLGNPLEAMELSFEINPETFATCRNEEVTPRVKTPGVFIGKDKTENLKFKSTKVHTMGLDWYEVNGILSIKGVESEVKLFVSGIREPKEFMASKLVLEGQLDLTDWGIDYDLIVNGESNEHPTKWMHINMKIDLPSGC